MRSERIEKTPAGRLGSGYLATLLIAAAFALPSLLTTGCKPKYPNCKKDSHCQQGEYCVNNLCQECRDNGDCPEGRHCANGACRDIPGYCKGPDDCAAGQVCRDSRCGPCLSGKDCLDGKVCADGRCIAAQCMTTEDCPAGLSCVNYRCEVDQTQASTGGECHLEPIYFDFDSAELEGRMRRVLEDNYECLKVRKGRLTLEGHADPRGTTEYNMGLGDRRARIVRKLLKSMGIDPSQLRVVSKGEEEATGTSESGWSKDRRVDFD